MWCMFKALCNVRIRRVARILLLLSLYLQTVLNVTAQVIRNRMIVVKHKMLILKVTMIQRMSMGMDRMKIKVNHHLKSKSPRTTI